MNIQSLTAPVHELGHPSALLAPVLFSSPVSAERDGSWLCCLAQSYAEGVI